MFLIVAAFMLIAYSAFSNARIAQQNKVWTGMAKETAHQLGTPISSLMGWLKLLENNSKDKEKIYSDIKYTLYVIKKYIIHIEYNRVPRVGPTLS